MTETTTPRSKIRDAVIDAFVTVFGFSKESVIPTKSLEGDFQFDHEDWIDLIEELEDVMNVDIFEEEFQDCKTVADVIAYCEKLDTEHAHD